MDIVLLIVAKLKLLHCTNNLNISLMFAKSLINLSLENSSQRFNVIQVIFDKPETVSYVKIWFHLLLD